MQKSLKTFKARALALSEVRSEYNQLADEFAFLDEILKARAESGLSQAEVAARIGTTQSAVARLESSESGHSPSIATLQRYASAIGYKIQVRLIKERDVAARTNRGRAKVERAR